MKAAVPDLDSLIRRCQAHDEKAHGELFRAIRADLFRILFAILGPDQDLEDVLQMTALEIFRSIPSFEGKSKFSTWMYRIAANVAFQHLRRRKHAEIPTDFSILEDALSDPFPNPAERVELQEDLRLVSDVLDALGPKKRAVYLLHEVEGYSPEEIAELLDSSRFTVKSRLFYARKAVNKKLRQRAAILAGKEKKA